MKSSIYKSYDDLPLFLNAELVTQTLGISSAYELMHEQNFPALRVGSRFVVPKEKFRQWVERQIGGVEWTHGRSEMPSRTISLCPMKFIS